MAGRWTRRGASRRGPKLYDSRLPSAAIYRGSLCNASGGGVTAAPPPSRRDVSAALDACWALETEVDVAMERVAKRNLSNPGWENLTLDDARARIGLSHVVVLCDHSSSLCKIH
jgi:hypothetical protein